MAVHDCSVSHFSSWSVDGFAHCTLNPLGNPTSKSEVELNQVNMGVLNTSFSAYSLVWENVTKIGPDIMMVMSGCPVLLVVNFPISIQLMNGRHSEYLKHTEIATQHQ
jgi:hypothetical protein